MVYLGNLDTLNLYLLKKIHLCSPGIQNGCKTQDGCHMSGGEIVLFDKMWIYFDLNELFWAIWTFGIYIVKKNPFM